MVGCCEGRKHKHIQRTQRTVESAVRVHMSHIARSRSVPAKQQRRTRRPPPPLLQLRVREIISTPLHRRPRRLSSPRRRRQLARLPRRPARRARTERRTLFRLGIRARRRDRRRALQSYCTMIQAAGCWEGKEGRCGGAGNGCGYRARGGGGGVGADAASTLGETGLWPPDACLQLALDPEGARGAAFGW